MQNIIQDIKNNSYRQIYLLYGEENYLKKVYKDKLKEAIVGKDDSINYNYFEGKNISVKTVIDIAETLPFFAEHRLIILENSGFFKNANEDIAAYIKEVPETTILIFVEEEIDKRGKLYKYIKEHGYISEMGRQNTSKLVPWILKILKKENKKITENEMKLFLTKTGDDMENILRELEKLISYTYGREVITAQDIEQICSTQITGKIFDMITAVSEKNQRKALELYQDLLTLKEPPMRILFLISRQFNLMLQVKELQKAGCDTVSIAKQTGLQSFLVGKYAAQARKFSTEFLKQALTECVEFEEAIKTGKMEDQLSVELLILQYSRT